MPSLGWPELLIILVVALLLFGGTRLAGLGKSAGRSIREFKEETSDLKSVGKSKAADATDKATGAVTGSKADVVDADVVKEHNEKA